MSHIFISYSRKDTEYAFKLKDQLQDKGFDVWIDNEKLSASDRWQKLIGKAIHGCSAFVLIMTPDSEKSDWVQDELALARKNEKPIFPLLLKGGEWVTSLSLAAIQYLDVLNKQLPPLSFFKGLESFAQRSESGIRGIDVTPKEISLASLIHAGMSAQQIAMEAAATNPNKLKRDKILQAPRMIFALTILAIIAMTIIGLFSIATANKVDSIEEANVSFSVMRANGIPIWAAPEQNLEYPIIVYQGATLIAHAQQESNNQTWYLVAIPGRNNEYGWVLGADVYTETGDENRLPDYDSFSDKRERFPIAE